MELACLLVVLLQQCRSILSPSGERTFTLVFLKRIVIASTVSFGRLYASRIYSIFPLCMESKALVKSTNGNVARTPSRILRMVNICEVVDCGGSMLFGYFSRCAFILYG